MESQLLKMLENKLDSLIELCDQLNEENKALKANEAFLVSERTRLMEKNDEAKHKVESMLTRLKSLEQNG